MVRWVLVVLVVAGCGGAVAQPAGDPCAADADTACGACVRAALADGDPPKDAAERCAIATEVDDAD